MRALAYRDDPSRTAAPYQGPGESEPDDAPTVTQEQAVAAVTAVLANEAEFAFGETAEWWVDALMNELANLQGHVLLSLLIGAACPSIGQRLNEMLGRYIEQTANGLLAEMDPDQLEHCGVHQ